MRKEKTENSLTFYDVKVWSTPGDYYECLRVEDPDITEDYYFIPFMDGLPYQDSAIRWETGNGIFRLFGKITKSYNLTFTLYKEVHNED